MSSPLILVMQETLKADGRFWYHTGAACMRAKMAVIVWYTYALEEYGNIVPFKS
jgi:hypothetical protein